MIYCWRNMIYLLRKHEIISVPFIREVYIIRISGYHRASDIIRDQRERISLKKATCFRKSLFFMERVTRLELATSTLARWRSTG